MTKEQWMLEKYYENISENKRNLFEEIIHTRTRYVTVVLENLFQPHNAAAVLRSCDCFGVQDVHIIENDNEFEPNKEIDMGASKWLNQFHYNEQKNNTLDCINSLKAKGYKIIATTPHTNDQMIDELAIDEPVALLLGTEAKGLSDLALENSDGYVKLPMYGFTESFNISVSAALALFSVTERMRKDESIKWQLSDEEKLEIKLQWAKKVVKHSHKLEKLLNERYDQR